MIAAVFVTNFWIAALRTRNANSASRVILESCLNGEFAIVLSQEMLDEFDLVIRRPKIGLSPTEVNLFRAFLTSHARMVSIAGAAYGCADPDDDKVLETAIVGNAQYLVTFDKALLDGTFRAMAASNGVTIVDYGQFLAVLRGSGADESTISQLPASALSTTFETFLTDIFQEIIELVRKRVELESRPTPKDDEEGAIFLDDVAALEYQTKRALMASTRTSRSLSR